jgi:MYXO-CTERM domain-containing protein
MRETELGRLIRRAVLTGSLVMVGAVVPQSIAAQTAQDSAANQSMRDTDDDDGMDIGWIGLLGLAGLLGLRRRDNVDTHNTRRTP